MISRLTRGALALSLGVGCAQALLSQLASASNTIRFDSASYLRTASYRSTSSGVWSIAPDLKTESPTQEGALRLEALGFIEEPSTLTAEVTEAYWSWKLRSEQEGWRHKLSLGRKAHAWSQADQTWKLGQWSPRFNWDPLKPRVIGLTGFFYEGEIRNARFMVFASPISIPERGYPIREENGRLVSASPSWIPPFEQVTLLDQRVAIHHSIEYPPLSKLLLQPSLAAAITVGGSQGWSTGFRYGYMPIHPVDLAVDARYDLASTTVDAILHPSRLSHHLFTGEARWASKYTELWASLTRELPGARNYPEAWLSDPVGPSWVSAIGAGQKLSRSVEIHTSYLRIDEQVSDHKDESFKMLLPHRYIFNEAWKLQGSWQMTPRHSWAAEWTYDIPNRSSLISIDLLAQPFGRAWRVGLGSDHFISATQKGFLGQYLGDDRFRGSVSYVF